MSRVFQILLLVFISISGYSNILEIGKNSSFTRIKDALNSAVNGDTLIVNTGHYKEQNIIISKAIVLIGRNFPILDGENKYEVVSIKANNVLVSGFKIIHSGISSIEDYAGIKIYNASNVIIKSNILDDTFFGIYVQYGKHCRIENNLLNAYSEKEQESGNGIHCWKSDSLQVIGNTIKGHRDGIYFEFVTHSVIWRNISKNNLRYGLHFMFSNDDNYYCNVFKNNGAGVAVMFSKKVSMIHNYFEENWGDGAYGLLLKEISDSYISNNKFIKNTVGILMEGASRVFMQFNVFKSNGWAMKIQASCMDVTVINNNFKSNTFDIGTNGSLVLNKFNNNYWDKYEGYDINKDKFGDVPYRPLSMYAMVIEQNPPAMILFRSLMATLLDKTEKIIPSLTPENLLDEKPYMKPLQL